MDYLVHQRRLFPLIAQSYALQFAQNELVAKLHDLQTADDPDAEEQRELESRAAGLKAANTWHATRGHPGGPRGLRRCGLSGREPADRAAGRHRRVHHLRGRQPRADPAGGQGTADRLRRRHQGHEPGRVGALRRQLRRRPGARNGLRPRRSCRRSSTPGRTTRRRAACSTAAPRSRCSRTARSTCCPRWRAGCSASPRRCRPFDAFNAVQDHVLHTATAHIDRIVLEAFVAGIDALRGRRGPRASWRWCATSTRCR